MTATQIFDHPIEHNNWEPFLSVSRHVRCLVIRERVSFLVANSTQLIDSAWPYPHHVLPFLNVLHLEHVIQPLNRQCLLLLAPAVTESFIFLPYGDASFVVPSLNKI
jgi:hypothetical protein